MYEQAISSRLQDSELFLKELLKRAFSLIYSNTLESHSSLLLTYFSDVKLLDATTISLPEMIATLSKRELFLADLGYFDTNQLQKIGKKSNEFY